MCNEARCTKTSQDRHGNTDYCRWHICHTPNCRSLKVTNNYCDKHKPLTEEEIKKQRDAKLQAELQAELEAFQQPLVPPRELSDEERSFEAYLKRYGDGVDDLCVGEYYPNAWEGYHEDSD